jgi:hypothetical protein
MSNVDPQTLQNRVAERSTRDLIVVLVSGSTLLILLLGGYLGYQYRYDHFRYLCQQISGAYHVKGI